MYYIKGDIAETEYNSLKSLTNQTIFSLGSSENFVAFKQNKDLQKMMYDKCIAFIFKGGLAYEVIKKSSRFNLDIIITSAKTQKKLLKPLNLNTIG
jgi:hypothetical protein